MSADRSSMPRCRTPLCPAKPGDFVIDSLDERQFLAGLSGRLPMSCTSLRILKMGARCSLRQPQGREFRDIFDHPKIPSCNRELQWGRRAHHAVQLDESELPVGRHDGHHFPP